MNLIIIKYMKEKKFIFVDNGQPCNIGDFIQCVNSYGIPINIVVTMNVLTLLIKHGVVVEVSQNEEQSKEENKKVTNPDLNTVIDKISRITEWKTMKTANILDKLSEVNPAAVITLALKIIAVELDKKYKDHISNSPEIFVLSMLDGKIHSICKSQIKNFKNFAAFRTLEDAQFACNILKDELKEMFK